MAAPAKAPRKPAPKPRAKAAPATDDRRFAGIGSAAVQKATGKGWSEWLKILDRDGAKKMSHSEIAALLSERHGVPPWWSQMVTVGYEQARGMRAKHEKPGGFEISASKTVGVPLAALFRAWNDGTLRQKWLPGADLAVRKATPSKSMRITWDSAKGKDATSVSVNFYAKPEGRSMVSLNHGKLKSAAAGEKAKRFWAARLEAMKSLLEG